MGQQMQLIPPKIQKQYSRETVEYQEAFTKYQSSNRYNVASKRQHTVITAKIKSQQDKVKPSYGVFPNQRTSITKARYVLTILQGCSRVPAG
jgi:hypothetical protein